MPEDQKPTGKVQEIENAWLALKDVFAAYRLRAIRNFRYVTDDQIEEKDKKQRERTRRPIAAMNILKPVITYLAGLLQQSRLNMKAVPRNDGDEKLAAMHTMLVSDFAMRNCDGYKSFARAVVDAAIAGIGWLNNYWDVWRDTAGKWFTEAVDPFMVMFDPDVKTGEFQKSCRYVAFSGFYSSDEIAGVYSDADEADLKSMKDKANEYESRPGGKRYQQKPVGWAQRFVNFFDFRTNRSEEYGPTSDFVDAKNGMYRVIEWHDRRVVSGKKIYSPITQQSERISKEDYLDEIKRQMLLEKYPQGRFLNEEHEEFWITVVVPALLPNKVLKEQAYPVQNRGFQFKPIFCYDFHPDATRTTGVLDSVIATQDTFNSMLMSLIQYVLDTINPSYVASKEAIDPSDMSAWTSGERGLMKYYQEGKNAPVAERPTTDSGAISGIMQNMMMLRDQLASLNPTMQGYSESKKEGANLYAMKLQQGQLMLAALMGNLQQTMGYVFEYCDATLQRFMTFPRKIRLLNKTNDPQWLILNMPMLQGVANDVTQGEYDFQPEQVNSGPMQKQIARAEMADLTQHLPPALTYWPAVIKTYDVESVDEMVQFAKQKMGIADQQAAQTQQTETAKNTIDLVHRAAMAAKATMTPGQIPRPVNAQRIPQQIPAGAMQ